MRIEHPSKTLTEALGAALHQDLSPIRYQRWTPDMKKAGIPLDDPKAVEMAERRPRYDDVEVRMFPELWSSTALGYGGMGGAAMTPAYTVVVFCQKNQEACLYWGGGRLGWKFDLSDPNQMNHYNLMIADQCSSHIKALRREQAHDE